MASRSWSSNSDLAFSAASACASAVETRLRKEASAARPRPPDSTSVGGPLGFGVLGEGLAPSRLVKASSEELSRRLS
eukprot:scaffold189412_cov27-Tisochrysis_lutea.AAC.2